MTSSIFAGFMEWFRGAAVGALVVLHIDAEPAPESLQISRTGHVFHGKNYGAFYREAQKQLAVQKAALSVLTGPLSAVVETVCTPAKSTKRSWPRGDCDNHAKGPLDAITKAGIWIDDDHVTNLHVFKRYAVPGEAAGTRITIGRLEA